MFLQDIFYGFTNSCDIRIVPMQSLNHAGLFLYPGIPIGSQIFKCCYLPNKLPILPLISSSGLSTTPSPSRSPIRPELLTFSMISSIENLLVSIPLRCSVTAEISNEPPNFDVSSDNMFCISIIKYKLGLIRWLSIYKT